MGHYDFEAIMPLESKEFKDEDWYTNSSCPVIDDYVMEDSSNFASFMYQLVMDLIGDEDSILEMLGLSGLSKSHFNKYDSNILDDEEFDD